MHTPAALIAAAVLTAAVIAPAIAAGELGAAAEATPAPPLGPVGPLGPRSEHLPAPPPPGPGVVVDRRADGTLHVDVRCPPRDAIKDCAAVAGDLLSKLNVAVQAK